MTRQYEFFTVGGMRRTISAPDALTAYRQWSSEPDNRHAQLEQVFCPDLHRPVGIPLSELRDQDKAMRQPPGYPWEALTEWANNAKAQHDIEDPDGIVAEAVNVIARMKGVGE